MKLLCLFITALIFIVSCSSDFDKGLKFKDKKDYVNAKKYLIKACESTNNKINTRRAGCANLGEIYREDIVDFQKAYEAFDKACTISIEEIKKSKVYKSDKELSLDVTFVDCGCFIAIADTLARAQEAENKRNFFCNEGHKKSCEQLKYFKSGEYQKLVNKICSCKRLLNYGNEKIDKERVINIYTASTSKYKKVFGWHFINLNEDFILKSEINKVFPKDKATWEATDRRCKYFSDIKEYAYNQYMNDIVACGSQ